MPHGTIKRISKINDSDLWEVKFTNRRAYEIDSGWKNTLVTLCKGNATGTEIRYVLDDQQRIILCKPR